MALRYLSYGAAGIASRKRGMPANNCAPDALKLQVLALLREKYSDFGPHWPQKNCENRTLTYQVFGKLTIVDQGAIVDNKRLGAVLKLVQVQQDERDRDGQRERR